MSEGERLNKTVGFKVTPSQRAELERLMVEAGCSNMTDLLRGIVREYEESHKQGSKGHVNWRRETNIDDVCARFREFLEKELTEVTGRGDDDDHVIK